MYTELLKIINNIFKLIFYLSKKNIFLGWGRVVATLSPTPIPPLIVL
jgi:hypothetical protein